MSDLAKFVFFAAGAIAFLVAMESLTGQPLFDDADARTVPFHLINATREAGKTTH